MDKLQAALTTWDIKKDVSDFIKERMGLKSEGSELNHAEEIIDKAIERAKTEEKPDWTNLLLNSIKADKIKDLTQTNVFLNANAVSDETLKKLVNVTPIKTKIEELI